MLFFWKNNLYRDFIIAMIIVVSPFLFYLYKFVPKNTKQWKTYFFEINLNWEYSEIEDAFWYLSYKFIVIIILSLWYLTCSYRWRYVILIPFIIEIHKIVGYFFSINNSSNDYRISHSLLVCIPLIILLTYLSVKLKYSSYSNINQQLDYEIDNLICNATKFNKKKYLELKKRLIQLKKKKKHIDKKDYLIQLIKLREEYCIEDKINSI